MPMQRNSEPNPSLRGGKRRKAATLIFVRNKAKAGTRRGWNMSSPRPGLSSICEVGGLPLPAASVRMRRDVRSLEGLF